MQHLEVSSAVRHIYVIRRLKVNLTIHGAIYSSQHFPFGAAFVFQAGKFEPYYVCMYVYVCVYIIIIIKQGHSVVFEF